MKLWEVLEEDDDDSDSERAANGLVECCNGACGGGRGSELDEGRGGGVVVVGLSTV